jgi:class 3 adenylate cyclase
MHSAADDTFIEGGQLARYASVSYNNGFLTSRAPLTKRPHRSQADRALVTVLFTDIVGSTECAAALGDRRWAELLLQHHAIVRKQLQQFGGREIDTAGDGFLASFSAPERAVRCALAIVGLVETLGIKVRAGIHTGELETIGKKIGGIGLHIGARVVGLAAPSEVLVSSTVKDLVAGSGLRFKDHGVHILKGVPGEWRARRPPMNQAYRLPIRFGSRGEIRSQPSTQRAMDALCKVPKAIDRLRFSHS